MDVLNGLNPAQKEAVESIEGPLLILAGFGLEAVMDRRLRQNVFSLTGAILILVGLIIGIRSVDSYAKMPCASSP